MRRCRTAVEPARLCNTVADRGLTAMGEHMAIAHQHRPWLVLLCRTIRPSVPAVEVACATKQPIVSGRQIARNVCGSCRPANERTAPTNNTSTSLLASAVICRTKASSCGSLPCSRSARENSPGRRPMPIPIPRRGGGSPSLKFSKLGFCAWAEQIVDQGRKDLERYLQLEVARRLQQHLRFSTAAGNNLHPLVLKRREALLGVRSDPMRH